MVHFKKQVNRVLPYDRKKYLKFWRYDDSVDWYGASFQLPGGYEGREIDKKEFLANYEAWFRSLILKLDNGSSWIVNHDHYDIDWLPNNQNNLKLLRTLFRKNNIENNFRGALVFDGESLLKFTRDLLTYPIGVFNTKGTYYADLDISHGKLPIIIKISGHSNIDLLSSNKELFDEVVKENVLDYFIVRPYSGTILNLQ